ncbi:acetyl-CoA carboxylase [Streptomyces sp. TRM66268-LWL]|uniref:Acetyl-coenzyme A carboxylase carboxyl transferase subunits beta/alpha n=1 Tax=Streptomyces polyasparticus TaxID=2767826 RepID=A0ABR7SL06_9ACTN|nr:carboxyl transferase domain-containing protein [Streptomyces polyasparticus]MBC9716103.1 acetyl-CoA carboxylase [Streptomyces polyasparticus]
MPDSALPEPTEPEPTEPEPASPEPSTPEPRHLSTPDPRHLSTPDPRRLSAREAVALLTEEFAELPHPGPAAGIKPDGPLDWQGYGASLARAVERTGEQESVVCGRAVIGGTAAVLIAFEFGFLGGSLGSRTGDLIEAAHEHARAHRLPLVSLIATGGSRMQEGMLALTQLQRVAQESALTAAAGVPQLAVLRDPTTGGGWATLGAGADMILALPGAQVGFAGSRVRPADADPAAYTAEAQFASGHVDAVVPAEDLRAEVALRLRLLTFRRDGTPAPVPPAHGDTTLPETGWDAVESARSPARPRAEAYLDAYFTERAAVSGDRCGGRDPGMLCGFGLYEGSGGDADGDGDGGGGGGGETVGSADRGTDGSGPRTIAYAAQCGTATRPSGYRTAARLIRLADRLGLPVLTLVDTPGAANDAAAEAAGAGPAIAELFTAVATARVPVTTLLIGEGGSGGALALAAPGNTWVAPSSYFSVIAPELAAAILKRPDSDVQATANELRLRPQDLVDLGVARGVAGTSTHPNKGTVAPQNR